MNRQVDIERSRGVGKIRHHRHTEIQFREAGRDNPSKLEKDTC